MTEQMTFMPPMLARAAVERTQKINAVERKLRSNWSDRTLMEAVNNWIADGTFHGRAIREVFAPKELPQVLSHALLDNWEDCES